MRKRLRKEAEDLALSIEAWLGNAPRKGFSIIAVMNRYGVDAGSVRRAIKILKDQGKLRGGGQEWNWPFGAIIRGRRRSWELKG